MEYTHVSHTFGPVFQCDSRILILGSFPSVKSRETSFYYGHPQNRFWKMMSTFFNEPLPPLIDEKRAFLLRHKIALWDVIESCDIAGSSDSSIKNVVPNDINHILSSAPIEKILCNGGKAFSLFQKHCTPLLEKEISVCQMPSTSPANAAWSLERLMAAWGPNIPH